MTEAFLEIIRSDGSCERRALAGERVTVGRDVNATISLVDNVELEPLHLLLAPRDDGCWVSTARGAQQSTRRAGKPFENGVVPWGTELDCGALVFRLARAEAQLARRKRWILLARKVLLVMVVLWVARSLLVSPPGGPGRARAEAPALFADGPSACKSSAREAGARADETLHAADAKLERYPFEPYDGVVAVRLYRESSACAHAAGDRDGEAEARELADRATERVEADYRFHRLKLERALDAHRYREALTEARVLASMLRDHGDAYTEWLAHVDRVLEMRLANEEEDRR